MHLDLFEYIIALYGLKNVLEVLLYYTSKYFLINKFRKSNLL
jgi:hypothetical protein